MKFFILSIVLFPIILFGSIANITTASDGSLSVEESKHVQMLKETVSIDIHKHFAEFSINYRFKNTAHSPQKVTMGFAQKHAEPVQKIFNFKAQCNDKELTHALHAKTSKEKASDFYLFDVAFKSGEQKDVVVNYWMYPQEMRGLYSLFYPLQDAASWKSKVKGITLYVSLDKELSFSPKQLAKSNIFIEPKGYTINKDYKHLSLYLDYIKPSEVDDIELYYIQEGTPFASLSDTASSTYTIDGLNGQYFGAENILDGSLDTSWASDNPKGPKGEWIQIDFTDALHDIYKVGIFPGIGVNRGFSTTDHLKKATLIFSNGTHYSINFEDKPVMQYFDVNATQISYLKIRIDEVYEGSLEKKGYKGTVHISEVKVFDTQH